MVKIDVEALVEELRSEMRKALADAVRATNPDLEIDANQLYRNFVRGVRRRCGTASVPSRIVKT